MTRDSEKMQHDFGKELLSCHNKSLFLFNILPQPANSKPLGSKAKVKPQFQLYKISSRPQTSSWCLDFRKS